MMKDNNVDADSITNPNNDIDADTNANTDTDANINPHANADTNIFTWTVKNFSKCNGEVLRSKNFIIKDLQWNLRLFFDASRYGVQNTNISVHLEVAGDEFEEFRDQKVYAEYKIRIRNQLDTNHVEKQDEHLFGRYEKKSGFNDFMPLIWVYRKSKGFLKNDTLVVEVEFANVDIINDNF